MSTDWIKMRVDLREDPSVFRLAKLTKLDRLAVVGRLWAFWSWADKHAIEGHIDGADAADVDEIADKKGFAAALQVVGWLEVGDGFVAIPKHDRHTGESAKERSLKNARQARWRQSRGADVDATPSTDDDATPSTQPSTRVEKRREEQEIEEPTVLVGTAYRPPPCPNAEIVELYRQNLPQLPGVEVLNDTRKRAIACRWREVCADGKLDREAGLEWFAWYFAHASKSKFLTGQIAGKSGRIWQADFDFLMNASKFPRVVEGSYHKDAA